MQGMQSQLQWIFFQFFFLIKILDSVTALWVMIWILCCSTSPEINRIMLAKNLVLHSVKSHNSWQWLHYGIPRTVRCFDGRTWQQTGSTGDSVHSALPSESKMNPGSVVCSLVFVLLLWNYCILLFEKENQYSAAFFLGKINIKVATLGCLFLQSW